jgi:hypothetical protein
MGAATFETKAKGKSARDAFDKARERAQYDHGHSGYTGTIAEKGDFIMINLGSGLAKCDLASAREHAYKLIDSEDQRVRDKWGPAGCIALGNDEYFFFGWASC